MKGQNLICDNLSGFRIKQSCTKPSCFLWVYYDILILFSKANAPPDPAKALPKINHVMLKERHKKFRQRYRIAQNEQKHYIKMQNHYL